MADLTETQMFDLAQYEHDGFAIIPDLLGAQEVDEIFGQIGQVFDAALTAQGEDVTQFGTVDEKYLRLKTAYPELKSHCYDVLGQLDSVQRALALPELIEIGRAIYQTPLLAGYRQVRIDDPSDDRLLPMHQELELLSLFNLNIWLPLVDVDSTGGSLRLQPGSHKTGLHRHCRTDKPQQYWSLPDEVIDETKIIELALSAGDALVFHPFLFHGSLGNRSDRIRWTLVGRWAELHYAPYLRHAEGKKTMDRNPDPSAPGNDFVADFMADVGGRGVV